jgi:hypothetical protein
VGKCSILPDHRFLMASGEAENLMRKIFLFMVVSLDGYYEGPNGDISWHNVDEEFNEFAVQQTSEVDTLLFGRKTMINGKLRPKAAIRDDPEIADLTATQNRHSKPGFGDWNTRLAENIPEK